MAAATNVPKQMKAYGFLEGGDASVYKLFDLPVPKAMGRDLLVKNYSAAFNPVDFKVRRNAAKRSESEGPLIPGWDAAGVVVGIGKEVMHFKLGDEVYYSGSSNRPGTYAEYTLVDERITARKPRTLNWTEAATVPLTALSAWEGLIEQLGLPIPLSKEDEKLNSEKSILIIGGGGGLGSMAIQLAKRFLKIGKVIATASRKETIEFAEKRGADMVINHRQTLLPQLEKLGFKGVDYIFNATETDYNWDQLAHVLNPYGKVVLLTNPTAPASFQNMLGPFFLKHLSVTFEMVFTRPLLNYKPEVQSHILEHVGKLFDQGILESSVTHTFDFTLEDLKKANSILESGTSIGKMAFTIVDGKMSPR
jgi:zinc-binding alcohol dehydrogenase family protein